VEGQELAIAGSCFWPAGALSRGLLCPLIFLVFLLVLLGYQVWALQHNLGLRGLIVQHPLPFHEVWGALLRVPTLATGVQGERGWREGDGWAQLQHFLAVELESRTVLVVEKPGKWRKNPG
jgi:hypothetical protein